MLSVAWRPGDLYTSLGSAFWEEVRGCAVRAGQLRRLAGWQISLRKETCSSWRSLPLETFVFLDQLKVSLNPWREYFLWAWRLRWKDFAVSCPTDEEVQRYLGYRDGWLLHHGHHHCRPSWSHLLAQRVPPLVCMVQGPLLQSWASWPDTIVYKGEGSWYLSPEAPTTLFLLLVGQLA